MDWAWTELGAEALSYLRGCIGPEGVDNRVCPGPKLFQACAQLTFVRVLAFLPNDQDVCKRAATDLLNGLNLPFQTFKKGLEGLADLLSTFSGNDHYLLCASMVYGPEQYSEEDSTHYTFYGNELYAVCFPGASVADIVNAIGYTQSCVSLVGVLAPAKDLELSPYIGRELPEEIAERICARVRYVFSAAWDDEGFIVGEVAESQGQTMN